MFCPVVALVPKIALGANAHVKLHRAGERQRRLRMPESNAIRNEGVLGEGPAQNNQPRKAAAIHSTLQVRIPPMSYRSDDGHHFAPTADGHEDINLSASAGPISVVSTTTIYLLLKTAGSSMKVDGRTSCLVPNMLRLTDPMQLVVATARAEGSASTVTGGSRLAGGSASTNGVPYGWNTLFLENADSSDVVLGGWSYARPKKIGGQVAKPRSNSLSPTFAGNARTGTPTSAGQLRVSGQRRSRLGVASAFLLNPFLQYRK